MKAVTGRVDPGRCGQCSIERAVVAIFELLEVAAHVTSAPGGIAGQGGDLVPVLIVGIDHDERIVCRAAAQSTGSRVKNAVLLRDEFVVFLLLCEILVVPKKEFLIFRALFSVASPWNTGTR